MSEIENELEYGRPTDVPAAALDAYMVGVDKLPQVLAHMGFSGMRPGQDKVVRSIMMGCDTVAILPTSTGKCFAAGTRLLTHSGSPVKIEDVSIGDLLMGPDSKSRRVEGLVRGRAEMFEIRPIKGDPHVVNGEHMLSLIVTPGGPKGGKKDLLLYNGSHLRGGDIVDISVTDYLTQNKTFKHRTKLWKVGVDYENPQAPLPDLPPYILGLWLGDGSLNRPSVTKPDAQIRTTMEEYAEQIEGDFVCNENGGNPTFSVTFAGSSRGCVGGSNRMTNALRDVGVYGEKHIPERYARGSRRHRLELLAGLLDTDGSLTSGGGCYEITFVNQRLADDTRELAMSLGLRASTREKWVKLEGWESARCYYRTHISGDMRDVPCRIPRKRYTNTSRRTDHMRRGFSVVPVGVGDYYGVTLSGDTDRRMLLADYTVTHNSAGFIIPTLSMGWKTIIIYPLLALIRDQAQAMQKLGLAAAAVSSEESDAHNASVLRDWAAGELQFMLVSPERFANKLWAETIRRCPPDFVAMDECHTLAQWADTFRPGYKFAGELIRDIAPKVVAAFSATLSPEAEKEARKMLGIPNAHLVYYYPRRANLHLQTAFFQRAADAFPWIAAHCEGPTVCYCSTTARVDEYTHMMQSFTRRPLYSYHGKMAANDKKWNQDKFKESTDAIIFATNAFGMGVDKGDIRNVVHLDIPGTLIALAQECVHPDSMISTASGIKVASEVVAGEKMLDYHFDVGEYAPAMTTQTMESQTEKLVQIRTKLGSTLNVSPNHPVFVHTSGGVVEVPAADVQIGDQLLAQLHLPPADTTPVDVVGLLSDCPEPVFIKVNPDLVDRLREKLSPVEVSRHFHLSRSYDYNAYKEKKHGRLDYWLEACAAVGISPAELRDNITHFKTRSSRSIVLPTTLTADFGWWLGIVATDGHVSRVAPGGSKGYGSWRVRLGSTNESIANRFAAFSEALGVNAHRYTRQPDGRGLAKQPMYMVECSHPLLVHLCNKAGIPSGKKSYSVNVPKWLRTADVPLRAGFIAGVIDGDGCLAKDKYQLRVHSAAWGFLSGVCMLLRGFGIPATCYAEDYTCKAEVMTASAAHGYSLRVSSTEYYEQLREVVASHSCKTWQPLRPPNTGQDMTSQRQSRRPTITLPGGEWLQDEILEKSEVDYVGPVMNWRVEPGNQLVVDGILTHNCGRGGRDGKDAWCTIIHTPEGERTQRFFIASGNPTERDIRLFLAACKRMMSGKDGLIDSPRADILREAGLSVGMSQSIMSFCLGERLLLHDTDAAKIVRVRFLDGVTSFTDPEKKVRNAIRLVGTDKDNDGWLHCPIPALEEQASVKFDTVRKRLVEMQSAGKLEWIRPSLKPLRFGVPIDSVPRDVFDRLNAKAAQANANLQAVIDYCATPDDEKHDFLESHLNR